MWTLGHRTYAACALIAVAGISSTGANAHLAANANVGDVLYARTYQRHAWPPYSSATAYETFVLMVRYSAAYSPGWSPYGHT